MIPSLENSQGGLQRKDPPSPPCLIHIYCPALDAASGLPLLCRASQASATSLNPEFTYQLFDRPKMEAFVETEFPEYAATFRSFPFPIQQFDFFRYLAVYRLGGIYLDLDVFLASNLGSLTELSCVFPYEELTLNRHLRRHYGIDWELGNYAFGAQAGHPFLKAVIENCVKGQSNPAWTAQMLNGIPHPFRQQLYVTNSTGPGLVTRTFAEHPELQPEVTVLFPQDVCNEATWHRFGNFGVHLMKAGWRKPQSYWRTRLARLWEVRRRRSLLRESLGMGPTRNGPWRSLINGE